MRQGGHLEDEEVLGARVDAEVEEVLGKGVGGDGALRDGVARGVRERGVAATRHDGTREVHHGAVGVLEDERDMAGVGVVGGVVGELVAVQKLLHAGNAIRIAARAWRT